MQSVISMISINVKVILIVLILRLCLLCYVALRAYHCICRVLLNFQTEAPLLIRPMLSDMTKSEIHAVMVGGFGTIAGSVLATYISIGVSVATAGTKLDPPS